MSVRLAQHSDQLPVSIYVEGVRITDKHNLNGGAFADIYRGKYNDGTVAVKRLRMTLYQSSDQRAKTAKVRAFHSGWKPLPFLGDSPLWQRLSAGKP